MELDDLVDGVGVVFDIWSSWELVEHIGPGLHGAEVVDEIVVYGACAHIEWLVELFLGEGFAGLVEVLVGPAVVGDEDACGICWLV